MQFRDKDRKILTACINSALEIGGGYSYPSIKADAAHKIGIPTSNVIQRLESAKIQFSVDFEGQVLVKAIKLGIVDPFDSLCSYEKKENIVNSLSDKVEISPKRISGYSLHAMGLLETIIVPACGKYDGYRQDLGERFNVNVHSISYHLGKVKHHFRANDFLLPLAAIQRFAQNEGFKSILEMHSSLFPKYDIIQRKN